MTGFLKTGFGVTRPADPTLAVYERGHRDPALRIDANGKIWLHKFMENMTFDDWDGEFAPTVEVSRVLYADVPVPIPTEWGFMLLPLNQADNQTGPVGVQPEGEDPVRTEE